MRALVLGIASLLWAATLSPAEETQPAAPALSPADEYRQFLAEITKPAALLEFAEKADEVIDGGEKADAAGVGTGNVVRADTKTGLHLECSIIRSPQVILYYASLSRRGEMLKYTDAATLFALFCNRAGLTHPIQIKEGEKPIFYAQWLIKPSDWKELRKKMLEVRAANRAETDIVKALKTAVGQEVAARAATKK